MCLATCLIGCLHAHGQLTDSHMQPRIAHLEMGMLLPNIAAAAVAFQQASFPLSEYVQGPFHVTPHTSRLGADPMTIQWPGRMISASKIQTHTNRGNPADSQLATNPSKQRRSLSLGPLLTACLAFPACACPGCAGCLCYDVCCHMSEEDISIALCCQNLQVAVLLDSLSPFRNPFELCQPRGSMLLHALSAHKQLAQPCTS